MFSFAQASSVLEPYNQNRKIIGFDTFAGFPSISREDKQGTSQYLKRGAYKENSYKNILQAAKIHDAFRLLNKESQVELVRGNMIKTVPKFVKTHPELLIALLYLDCDLYRPTKTALQYFLPLMPKGAIVAFDELNAREFPGETVAFKETIKKVGAARLKKLPFSKLSYFVVGEKR